MNLEDSFLTRKSLKRLYLRVIDEHVQNLLGSSKHICFPKFNGQIQVHFLSILMVNYVIIPRNILKFVFSHANFMQRLVSFFPEFHVHISVQGYSRKTPSFHLTPESIFI